MKQKLLSASLGLVAIMPAVVIASAPIPDDVLELPEPSTLGLFVAAAIAVTVLTKLKK